MGRHRLPSTVAEPSKPATLSTKIEKDAQERRKKKALEARRKVLDTRMAEEWKSASDLLRAEVGRSFDDTTLPKLYGTIRRLTKHPEPLAPTEEEYLDRQKRYLNYFVKRAKVGAKEFYNQGLRETTPEHAEILARELFSKNASTPKVKNASKQDVKKEQKDAEKEVINLETGQCAQKDGLENVRMTVSLSEISSQA